MTEELKYTDWTKDLPPKGANGKFGPKMTFEDRMAWYAIYHTYSETISMRDVAVAAGISPPVAHALLSPHSVKYKSIKAEYKRLGGSVGTTQKYVTDEHIRRIQAIVKGRNVVVPKPGTANYGGHDFIITQREDGRWQGESLKMPGMPVNEYRQTRDEVITDCLEFAKFL